jgi:hypothetical protein
MLWHHLRVKSILAAVLVATMIPAVGASADQESPTVRLLIEDRDLSKGLETTSVGSGVGGWRRIEVPMTGTPEETATRLASQTSRTVYVERSYRLLGPENEPSYDDQWSLENTGQTGGTPDADVDASAAWQHSTGAGVTVAVIDSGVEPTNPELDDQLWANSGETLNGLDDDGNGYVDDIAGWDFYDYDNDPSPVGLGTDDAHGTLVAGVIAAEVNTIGITGVAPDATIMNLRACDDGACYSFDAYRAILYAADMGADVINLSFGGPVPEDEGDPVLEAAVEYAQGKGVLVVTAAGNTPPGEIPDGEMIVPSELPYANNLAVAATDHNDNIASFSFYSENIDIAAPGVSILSTSNPGYLYVSGTSFSAPLTAGVAALLLSIDPGLGYAGVIEKLKVLADHPPGVDGKVESGRLNAGLAVSHKFIDTVANIFETDIEWAAGEKITKGCNPPTNTRYCPVDEVTREVMAAFLVRALDLPAASKDYFTDDTGSIFEDAINRLAESGITKGCGTEVFCPKNIVDRGQMAAFLVRALNLSDNGGGDLFADDDDSIFENDIDKLGTAGITKGCNPPANTLFCPNDTVDRGAMAAFLHRALG